MAYFAQLDSDDLVTQVIVVKDDIIGDKEFPDSQTLGEDFCKSLYGNHTKWVQTSPDKVFRKNFAGVGFKYDQALDAFIPPKPYQSWVLDPVAFTWESPVPYPDGDSSYVWDESSISWKETQSKPKV